MLNKINYFEIFTKDKVVCFLLLIHNIYKRLDNKFNKCISFESLSNIQSMPLVIQNPIAFLMMMVDQIQPLVCRRYLYYYLLMNL